MYRALTLLLLGIFTLLPLSAQRHLPADSIKVEQLLQEASKHTFASPSSLLVHFAQQLVGTPYVAATLEQEGAEQLVVNLRELDCTTLVESVAALTLTHLRGKGNFRDYTTALRTLRYREGRVQGYASRLHYFSDWIATNAHRGYLCEITSRYSTTPLPLTFNFISTHRSSYPALAREEGAVEQIRATERALSQQQLYYLPKAQLNDTLPWIESGDIIAITTSLDGLDVVHVGIALRQEGRLHLLHASSVAKRVLIDPRTLAQQLAPNSLQSGIRVVRWREW